MSELERRPMSGHERKAIEHMAAFVSQEHEHGDWLRDRLKLIPNGWRDWRLMLSLSRKLYQELCDTLTDAQSLQMAILEKHGECKVSMQNFTRNEDFELVHRKSYSVVLTNCLEGTCSICVKDEKEIHRCKLRKALDNIHPPMEPPRFGCAYRQITTQPGWKEHDV